MSNKSILIIEDEQAIREALSLFLNGEGYECQIAKDGPEALEKIRLHSFKAVLLDLHLSRQDGLKILEHITKQNPETVVIILTEYYHIDEAVTALRHGASKLLLKPIDFDELLEVIDQQLSLKNM